MTEWRDNNITRALSLAAIVLYAANLRNCSAALRVNGWAAMISGEQVNGSAEAALAEDKERILKVAGSICDEKPL